MGEARYGVKIKTEESEWVKAMALPPKGREPDIANISNSRLVTHNDRHSFEAEQFKSLRTKLLFPDSGDRQRSIMVCSALPREGKTFVSVNLAVSIAQTVDDHVLLVDSDLRNPSIGDYFGLGETRGLSDYLANDFPLGDLLVKTGIGKLTFLPAGRMTRNPSELILSKEMTRLLEEIKNRYNDRIVIVDSPPPTMVAEAFAVARRVDGIIVVVRYGKTKRKFVSELVKIVGREKIIGVVINRFDFTAITNYVGYREVGVYKKHYSAYRKKSPAKSGLGRLRR